MNDFMFRDGTEASRMYRAASFETAIKRYVKTLTTPIQWQWLIDGHLCHLTVSLLSPPDDIEFQQVTIFRLPKDWRRRLAERQGKGCSLI